MLFTSSFFLTLFLPVFLLIYSIAPRKAKSAIIVCGSYLFYGWWRLDFLALFIAVTMMNYGVSRGMMSTRDTLYKRTMLKVGIIGNIMVLGYFKYANFGVDSLNNLLSQPISFHEVILPIGISFYIFQCISCLVDIYRGDAKPTNNVIDFAAYIALFPQLIAGPVLRYKDLFPQFEMRTQSWALFQQGALRFAVGFCKKILIADSLAPLVDSAFALHNPSFADAWLGALSYTAQLYFDFSGYSDMAIGIGLMMGFRFMENFNAPYISRSITEFWQRWHISLSTWMRDYVYIPLGGSAGRAVLTYRNLFITMTLAGVWHGAGWGFMFWGMWHGFFLVTERMLGGKASMPYPRYIAWPLTFLVVVLGWVAFRADDMITAIRFYQAMCDMNNIAISDVLAWRITALHIAALCAAYAGMCIIPIWSSLSLKNWAKRANAKSQCAVMLLFVIALAKMTSQSQTPFLYFQF